MSKFQVAKPAIDPSKLAAFAAGAETHEASPAPDNVRTAPTPPPDSTLAPKVRDLPKSILIRLADTPGLAEKLQRAFHSSTYKSQQQLVVALLDEGLDRLIASIR